LYTFYQDDSKGSNEDYARDNLLESLSLAKELNKSVMPFVWHRYHDSNKTIGLQLIPSDEFKRYLNAVLSTSYKGTKVAGLVWWGSDQYYYNVKSPALVNEMNASGQTDFKTYHDNLIVKYGNVALDAIQGSR
jgi:hypothetical protein